MATEIELLKQLDDLAKYSWPIRRSITAEAVPSVIRAYWKSVLEVKPGPGCHEYYRSLLRAPLRTLVRRHMTLPTELLFQESAVSFEGFRYVLGPDVVFGYYMLPFEPVTFQFMKRQSGGLFIDAGANIGQYTIPLSARFDRVIAIEPNPAAIRILKMNLALNHITNVEIVPRALSADGGIVRLYEGEFPTTLSIRARRSPTMDVASVTFADLLRAEERVDLLKVDIEEAEEQVLLPAMDQLRKVSNVVIETHSRALIHGFFAHGFTCEVLGGWLKRWETVCATRAA